MRIVNICEYKKNKILLILSCLLFACFANVQCINRYLSAFLSKDSEEGGMLATLYIFFTVGIVIASYLSGELKFDNVSKRAYVIILYCIAFYKFTEYLIGAPLVPFNQFLVFSMIAMLIPAIIVIDPKIAIKCIMITSVPAILVADRIFVFVADWHQYISMGVTYSFMLPAAATIVYFLLFFREENKLNKVVTIIVGSVNLFYLFMMFTLGSRGPVVTALFALLLLYVIRYSPASGIIVNKKRLVIVLAFITFVLTMLVPILRQLSSFLANFGINAHVVEKFLSLALEGNVNNGRDIVYDAAIDGILSSPIWGHGFDRFDANTRLLYPHNSILQLLYDGGLILFGIVLFPLILKVKTIYKCSSYSNYAMLFLLLCTGFIGSMFSGNLWKSPLFWIFVGYYISCINQNEKYYE